MKLEKLKPRESRIAAVLLLLVVLVIAYFALLHWWFVAPLQQIGSQMDDLRDTQARFAAALAEKPQLQKRIDALGAGQASSSAFLPEDDANAAAAGLMQRVVDVVASHQPGGSCDVIQKMPVANPRADANDPYKKVAVSISLRCDVESVGSVMHALEQSTPYLFVDDISIYRNPVAAQKNAGTPMEVQFTLSGYIRKARQSGNNDDGGPSS